MHIFGGMRTGWGNILAAPAGTEELGHLFPQFASGTPWTAATIGVTGDVIADLSEDMSAEQKARKTYDNILRLCDDPDVTDVIRFLREREVVHYQRFGEALRLATEKMDQKNVYAVNPAFDRT